MTVQIVICHLFPPYFSDLDEDEHSEYNTDEEEDYLELHFIEGRKGLRLLDGVGISYLGGGER